MEITRNQKRKAAPGNRVRIFYAQTATLPGGSLVVSNSKKDRPALYFPTNLTQVNKFALAARFRGFRRD